MFYSRFKSKTATPHRGGLRFFITERNLSPSKVIAAVQSCTSCIRELFPHDQFLVVAVQLG
ncbi:hypothetical protein F442_14718 [Phytophthora nicotianae P10297]|uniref:Uncharacterized protein n=1 Tax=Phytophthora nicotianae P10297 TaxID=1317064 RepID=W2YRL1_PHYNI|nr:hypothetical protein F442_14718 [Phytophthora nicotianae P10297]